MEMVIDIEEKIFEELTKYNEPIPSGNRLYDSVLLSIYNGTPLPKGHGKLIDENELKKEAIRCEWSRSMYGILEHTLSYMKPIIEADKGGKR